MPTSPHCSFGIPITAGSKYWVVVQTGPDTLDTWDAWNQNDTNQTNQPFASRTNGVWTQQGSKLVGTGAAGATYQGASVALSAASDSSTKSDSDGAARALGIAGLAVGVLGFGTAIVALRRKNTAGS